VQPAVRELAIVIQPCGPARKNQCVTAMFWLHEGPSHPDGPPGQPTSRTSQWLSQPTSLKAASCGGAVATMAAE
jgi:hypothetical protein